MTGKIVIYGGSGGIGSATARLLHDRGCALHLVGRSEDKLSAIAPSLTRTPLAEGILSSEKMTASITSQHAMQWLQTTSDIAKLAAFLIYPEADWITGQIVGVDGGRSTLRARK